MNDYKQEIQITPRKANFTNQDANERQLSDIGYLDTEIACATSLRTPAP